jgi:voltage-gated potassium channel
MSSGKDTAVTPEEGATDSLSPANIEKNNPTSSDSGQEQDTMTYTKNAAINNSGNGEDLQYSIENNMDDVPIGDGSEQPAAAVPATTAPVAQDVKVDAPTSRKSHPKVLRAKMAASGKSQKKTLSYTPKKSNKPQSQTPPSDSSDFGPLVNRAGSKTEWNPFDGNSAPLEMFQITDGDDNHQTTGVMDSVAEEELNKLRMIFDSEYEKALQDQEISWKARFTATRLSFVLAAMLMILYLWLGCMFYRSEAGWSIPDSLLFTVYTVTTVGYGGPQPLPNTGAFHAFTCMYILVGISGVTVIGTNTYQMITLEATRMRSSPVQQKRQSQSGQSSDDASESEGDYDVLTREMARRKEQFMTELDDLVRQQPFFSAALDYSIDRFKETRTYLKTTRSGRILAVTLPFTGMILFGALVVGLIEGWTPLEAVYWSIVTLTTVGYGDYVPTKNSAVWFCTVFFIPSSLLFLSFFLAQVAKSYIHLHSSYVVQWERRIRRKNEKKRAKAERAKEAQQNAETSSKSMENAASGDVKVQPSPDEENSGFNTISYTEEEEEGGSNGFFFGDQAGNLPSSPKGGGLSNPLAAEDTPAMKYRENVIQNKFAAPDPQGKRAVSFSEALRSLKRSTQAESFKSDETSTSGVTRPSLGVRLRVQERIAKIIAVEVAGYQTGVIIKGSTVSVTIGSLRETSEKWKLPPRAWKAFRAVAFRSLLFVGERDLISDGVDALLRLNVMEFHGIFSPILAVMGDGNTMEAWLAATDLLADVELQSGEDRRHSGKIKPVFNGTFT